MQASHFSLLDAAETEAPLLDYLSAPPGHNARIGRRPLESTMLLQLFPPPPRYVIKQSFWERFINRSERVAADHLGDSYQ